MTPISALVVVLPERCYRCKAVTYPLVGLLVEPDPGRRAVFLDFDRVAATVATHVSRDELTRLRIGPIKPRHSRYRGTYLSNGCHACDAILGSHPLHEALQEFLSEGGSLSELVVARWHFHEIKRSFISA